MAIGTLRFWVLTTAFILIAAAVALMFRRK